MSLSVHYHNLKVIPGCGNDKTCTHCGACKRTDGWWWLMGYRNGSSPPCTASLSQIEQWANVPAQDRHNARGKPERRHV